MAEDSGSAAAEAEVNKTSPPSQQQQQDKVLAWHSYLAKELPRTLQESTDSAFQSARFLQQNSSTHLHTLQDFIPQIRLQYKSYEDAFFKKVKGELMSAREHPAVAGGIFVMASLLLMRGPRRFLLRQTLGRLQSEEAQFVRAEKNVKEFNLSVDLMRKESRKLLERAALAERDMKHGHAELMNSGSEIQILMKSLRKAEAEAVDVMDLLREISGREALKLRADVASMASFLRQQRTVLDKKIMKLSELGVPV